MPAQLPGARIKRERVRVGSMCAPTNCVRGLFVVGLICAHGMSQRDKAQGGMSHGDKAQGGMSHGDKAQGGMSQRDKAQGGMSQRDKAQGADLAAIHSRMNSFP
jgi:hypothetical protein